MPVDPKTLRITADDPSAPTPPSGADRPVVGVLIAGYGCYINPGSGHITKIEPVAVGVNHYVMAHLDGGSSTGDLSQRTTAFLTPPLDSEAEAQQMCDAIAHSMFMVLSTNPDTGGAHWPDPAPPVAERFGL